MSPEEFVLQGTPISSGIGIGGAYFLQASPKKFKKREKKSLEDEILDYKQAITLSIDELEILQKQLEKEKAFEGVQVLETHRQILNDPLITTEVEEEIKRTKSSGLAVLQKVLKYYKEKFEALSNPFFQERFHDVEDVVDRVMNHLQKGAKHDLSTIPKSAILFATDLTPSEVAQIKPDQVAAIVTARGGRTSHAAIIANAKGIPFVSNINFTKELIELQTPVIVDGRKGEVRINPPKGTVEDYTKTLLRLSNYSKSLEENDQKPVTKDGEEIGLFLNLDSERDFEDKSPFACTGVGLFRTEFLLRPNEPLPNEEEQYAIYSQLLKNFPDQPVVIRAFDFGGDKGAVCKKHLEEFNPALGFRAIRYLLEEIQLFKSQLRAIFRSLSFGEAKLLLPMISTIEEIKKVKKLIGVIKQELIEEGISIEKPLPIGCMVEVPSCALMVDHVVKHVEFLSIGTNDLSQFTMGADRSNALVSHIYSSHHPSVLRLIHQVATAAKQGKVPVSICGELAADPRFIPLLLGLGVRQLSLSKRKFPAVKNVIGKVALADCLTLAKKALTLESAPKVEKLVLDFYKSHVPEDQQYHH